MTTVQKINNDSESKRYQRNMTETQKRNSNYIKEGVIVNSYVKDPLLSLDETIDTLVISKTEIKKPEKLYEKEEKRDNKLFYIAGGSLGIMGIMGGFTGLIKNNSRKRLESTKEYLLPGITRNHCINDEIHQSIFSMIQSPNRRTILSAVGVIVLSSMAFCAKNFIDGFKEIIVKKKEADIQKNLQENLIEVETQSFSGKIEIIRSMLSDKAKEFSKSIEEQKNNVTFTSKKDNNENKNKIIAPILIGAGTLVGIVTLGYLSIKNIRSSENNIKKGIENTKFAINTLIKDFNNNEPINEITNHEGKVLNGKDAYKQVIENMLDSIYASQEEIDEYVSKMNMPEEERLEYSKHLKSSLNSATEKVNSAIGGSGRNKITYFSHVNDYLSFFYDWLMNPQNPQFKNLFIGITTASALAYCGKNLVEGIKEVEVKKYNADIELNLQKRLVATELRNFNRKKESAIEPLCDEFFIQKDNGKSAEELKLIADNILFEIKNGPPFVYS